MPSRSRSQQRLIQAAEHGATFPMAKQIRASMTHEQMHDFASGSERGKPEHVTHHATHQTATDGRHHRHLSKLMHEQTRRTGR